MKHNIVIEGYAYKLRPISLDDAQSIIDIRLEDTQRNKYIHKISESISEQEKWITEYFKRDNDFYFIIEDILTHKIEGLIAIYDANNNKAEWGRWVIKKGSLSAIESVNLIYQVAFEKLHLEELYSRTIENNASVLSFHNSIKQKNRTVLKDFFEINRKFYNAVEQYVDKDYYYSDIKQLLESKASRILDRNLKSFLGDLTFHHLGIATKDIQKEFNFFKILGYKTEGSPFIDELQGIKGQFIIAKDQPRLELLENLPNSQTLDIILKNRVKIYHMAYHVQDIKKTISTLINIGAKIISPEKKSVYFKKLICFLMLPNMMLIELIEI